MYIRDVYITLSKYKFIKLSRLLNVPLYVSPLRSSISIGAFNAPRNKDRGSYVLCKYNIDNVNNLVSKYITVCNLFI